MEYLYGNIMQYIAKERTDAFLNKRDKVENYGWFEKYYSLPNFTKTVISIEAKQEIYS